MKHSYMYVCKKKIYKNNYESEPQTWSGRYLEIGMVNLCQKGIDFVPKNNCAYSSDLIC